MSRDRIVYRNRVNAARSTGPRTAAGKALVAQNARRHGATGRPDPKQVAIWLRIILDAPDLALETLLEGTAMTRIALDLAQAEVRLATCQRALDGKVCERQAEEAALAPVQTALAETFLGRDLSVEAQRALRGFSCDALEVQLANLRGLRHEEQLCTRYLREARAQRRRAFAAWITVLPEVGRTPHQKAV